MTIFVGSIFVGVSFFLRVIISFKLWLSQYYNTDAPRRRKKNALRKLDGKYTKIQRVILNKSRKQHYTKQQFYGHLPPTLKTIQVRWTRHAGHCWKSKDELMGEVLLLTLTHGPAGVSQPARTYLHKLCANTRRSLKKLPGVKDDWDGWREREKIIIIHAVSATWRWRWWRWWW